jgi:endonuclease YncB( thermonuclease family)
MMARYLLSIFLIILGTVSYAAYPPVLTEVIPREVNIVDTAKYAFIPKVISGDTVAVQVKGGAVNVRIYGIEAPDGKWAIKARDYLQWRVERKDCAIEIMGRDRHGRATVRLYQGGADVGLQMVAMGLARACAPTDKAISLTQDAAKKHGIGMWGRQ